MPCDHFPRSCRGEAQNLTLTESASRRLAGVPIVFSVLRQPSECLAPQGHTRGRRRAGGQTERSAWSKQRRRRRRRMKSRATKCPPSSDVSEFVSENRNSDGTGKK